MIVYKAIGAVSAAMSHSGISKGRKNQQQGYNFRGIDDVLNALSTALVDAGLVILPRCVERIVVERETKSGGALFITWDESEGGEFPIGMIVVSPLGKGAGYSNKMSYFHSSMVRTVETVFGIKTFLNDAANQADLSDLFTNGL